LTLSRVTACEPLGPYVQVRMERSFDPGDPGQFHMLRPLAHDGLLARPLSAVASDEDVVSFLVQVRGPALEALARVGSEVEVLGPFGRGFDAAAAGDAPVLVGGGFGVALLAPLSRRAWLPPRACSRPGQTGSCARSPRPARRRE
jgi:NAD(P)H-flavin reductase